MLNVGTDASFPPYEFRTDDGQVVGFDIDLANALASKLNRELSILVMDFDVLPEALQAGTIDLIINSLSIFPEREEKYVLIPYQPIEINHLDLLFGEEIPRGVKSIEDLSQASDLPISVQSGTYPAAYLRRFKNLNILYRNNAAEVLLDLRLKKAIAIVLEPQTAKEMESHYKLLPSLRIPLDKKDWITQMGIGVKRENTKLIEQVRKALEELKENGVIKQLNDKWLKGEQAT